MMDGVLLRLLVLLVAARVVFLPVLLFFFVFLDVFLIEVIFAAVVGRRERTDDREVGRWNSLDATNVLVGLLLAFFFAEPNLKTRFTALPMALKGGFRPVRSLVRMEILAGAGLLVESLFVLQMWPRSLGPATGAGAGVDGAVGMGRAPAMVCGRV